MKQLTLPQTIISDGSIMGSTLTSLVARRPVPLILVGCLLAFVLGCQEEPQIRRYQVAREDPIRQPWRLLGAIIPQENQVWFFRLEGPTEAVALQKKAFDQFVQSIRFTPQAKKPIAWELPKDWQQAGGQSQFRYATLRTGPKEEDLEMTVVPLPPSSILQNVCRWRDQLGLEPIPDSKLGLNTKNIKVDDVPVTVVDITGSQPKQKMPRFALGKGKAVPPPPPGKAPLTFKTPAGWQQKPAGGIRLAAFSVGEAEVTVIPLGEMTGKLLANVNEWRKDIGLEIIGAGQLAKDVKNIVIAGTDAEYVDLIGPEKRILVVMLARGAATWFFKMKGPIDLVGREKPAFEEFVRSVQFTGPGS